MRQKRELDRTDREIMQLLATDGRRPFSEIAEQVDLSPPAVSDRVDRLQEQGVIRGFTIDVDRAKLQPRTPVLIELEVVPPHGEDTYAALADLSGIEHVFKTHDSRLLAHGSAPQTDLSGWLHENVDMEQVTAVDISLLDRQTRRVALDDSVFALPCPVCGNTVGSDGVSTEIGGETKSFCCPSCLESYTDEYEARSAGAD